MKITTMLLAAALSGCGMGVASAQVAGPLSGTELYEYCSAAAGANNARCLYYLDGFFEGYGMAQHALSTGGGMLCPGNEVSNAELRLMVLKELREDPTIMSQSARNIVTEAMLKSFGCKPRSN